MSTKPSLVPSWATDTTKRTSPSAGKAIVGFTSGERPPARVFNALLGLLGDWAQYLSDGVMTGAFTFGSTVGVTGVLTAADYKNSSTRTQRIAPATAQATPTSGPTFAANTNGWNFGTTGSTPNVGQTAGRLCYPVNLTFGDRITAWRAYIQKNSGSGTIIGQLYKYNANTLVETAIGAAATYPSSSGFDILSITGLSVDITNLQEFHYIVLTGGGTNGPDAAYHAEVDYIRP